MHFTKVRELLISGGVGLALGFLFLQTSYDSLPALPTAAGIPLLVLAIAELILAFSIRARIRTRRPLAPLAATRAVVLAKASSLFGGFMAGVWLGAVIYLLPRDDRLPAAAQDLPAAVVGMVSALILVGAALWLENCCRTPHFHDPERFPEKTD